jgi:nucleoside-diphosphate-sugar epimerase
MKILVTGGTGFLGRYLVSALLDRGHRVYVMGRNFSDVQDLIAYGAVPVACDLRDVEAVRAACAGMNTVYHMGALVSQWGDRSEFLAVNVEGTATVLAGCREHAVKRCIYISSTCVTQSSQGQSNGTEQAPYERRLTSLYSLSKQRAESLVKAATDVQTVIIRPSAVFGPGDKWLAGIVEDASKHRLYQFGNGQNLVDMTYVDNVIHALILALYAGNVAGKTYIITNDEHVVLWDMIRTLLYRLKCPNEARYVPLPIARAAAAAMEQRASLDGTQPLFTRFVINLLASTQTYDISAAHHDLNYKPLVSVAEGIERTVNALQTHRRLAM